MGNAYAFSENMLISPDFALVHITFACQYCIAKPKNSESDSEIQETG